MVDQLIFNFPSKKIYLNEDFYVSPSNQEAYDFVNSWPKWLKRIVNVYGPPGSGKTHIASIIKKKTTVLKINSSSLEENIINEFKLKEVLIIENLNEKISENVLFSIWNVALQDNKYLLITSRNSINNYKFKLKDLNSRVKSCLSIGIKLPSDSLISVILAKNFSDKQIKVDKRHLDYIIKRVDRSYEKISEFISILDKYSLKKGKPVGLKLIKQVLKML